MLIGAGEVKTDKMDGQRDYFGATEGMISLVKRAVSSVVERLVYTQ